MAEVKRLGRRTWLSRMAGGFVAVWAGMSAQRGPESWAGWLGWPQPSASAQGSGAKIVPAEMELEFQGQVLPVAAFVAIRGAEIAIVDALVPGNGHRIEAMIRQAGLDWRAVRHIILTHWHIDHVGSAADLAARAPQATVWAGEPDIPQIDLPRPIAPAHDGDEIFGLRIVATPGHTAGHISVLDPEASTLLTGDAILNIGGELALSSFNEDMVEALVSLRKLGSLGFERALFAHGVPIERGAAAELARLAEAGAGLLDLGALVDRRHNCLLHA